MTLSSSLNRNNYVGDGAQGAFAYQFRVDDESHLQVYLDAVLQGSGYAVSNVGNDNGGTVTFSSAPGAAVVITLLRALPLTQPTDIPTQGPLNSTALERQMDQTVMQVQQLDEKIGRSVVLPVSSDVTGLALPTPAGGNLLGWDSGATALQNYAQGALPAIVPSAFMATLLDDGDAATAQATLQLKDGSAELAVASLGLAAVDAILDTDANSAFLAPQRYADDVAEAHFFDKPAPDPKSIRKRLSWWPESGDLDWRVEQIGANIDLVAVNPRTGAAYRRYTSADFSWLGTKTAACLDAAFGCVVVGTTAGYGFLDFRNGEPTLTFRDTGSGLVDNSIKQVTLGLSGPLAPIDGNGARPMLAGAYGAGTDSVFITNDQGKTFNHVGTGAAGGEYGVAIVGGRLWYNRYTATNEVRTTKTDTFLSDIAGDDWAEDNGPANAGGATFGFGVDRGIASNGRDTMLFLSAEGLGLYYASRRDKAESAVGFDIDSTRMIARAGNHKSTWFLDSIAADRGPDGTTLTHTGGGLTIAAAKSGSTKQMVTGFDASNYAGVSSNVFNNASDPTAVSVDFRSDGALSGTNVLLNWTDGSNGNSSAVSIYIEAGGIKCYVKDSGGSTTAVAKTFGPTLAQLNDDPDAVHNVTLIIVPTSGIFIFYDGEFAGFAGNALFVNTMAPSGTNVFRIGEAVANSNGPHTASAPFKGSIGEVTLFEDAKPLAHDAMMWWAQNRIRSYDAGHVCILPANEAPTHGDVSKTVQGTLPEAIVCGPTKTFTLLGTKITEVDLATPGVNADVDRVYIGRSEIGLLSSTGQHYRKAAAKPVEAGLNGFGHNGGPRWLAPVGVVGIDCYMAAAKSNVTGDATNYTVPFDTIKAQRGLSLDAATGKITCLVSGFYDVAAHLDMEGWDASTTRCAGWVYINGATILFTVWDMTWNFAGSERLIGGSSERRWLNAGDRLELKAYAAGGAKVADVTVGGATSYQTSLLAHLVG